MKFLTCTHCSQRVFFENTRCGNCGSALGFVPQEMLMVSFSIDNLGGWCRLGVPGLAAQRPCRNYVAENVCNWMVAADDPNALCVSCRTTHIIPALSIGENHAKWATLEQAKRSLIYTLLSLRLPLPLDLPVHRA